MSSAASTPGAVVMLVVEGQTEQTFVRELLAPYLAERQVYLQAALIGKPGHKGGNIRWERALVDIGNFLRQRPDTYVSTMLDYFRIDTDWPGLAQVRQQQAGGLRLKADTKAAIVEQAMKRMASTAFSALGGADRFIPYIEVHEFEALLFSDRAILADALRVDTNQIAAIMAPFESPEEINDNPSQAPSQQLARVVRGYQKVVMGTLVAARIGLPKLRSACPHFDQWVSRLEGLGLHG